MMKILIYGTGKLALEKMNSLSSAMELKGFVETQKNREEFMGFPVYNVDEIKHIPYDEIHVANTHIETLEHLLNMNVKKNKIVLFAPHICGDRHLLLEYFKKTGHVMDIRFDGGLVVSRASFVSGIPYTHEMDFYGCHVLFNDDYTRYGTLKLLVTEIKKNNVLGDIAELGVYQGKFAVLLNGMFPERHLHLFDTFEGFPVESIGQEDLSADAQKGQMSDTNVDLVLEAMANKHQVVIHRGIFPDTIPEDECMYAFVSLDCDLYAPTLEGLRYFYPRLSTGGYIMLHDYNGAYADGVKKAVSDYEQKIGHLAKVPIPDEAGTIVIAK